MESGGEVTPIAIVPGEEEELSSSYRTCSRVYSERISSESSWTMTSSRSIQSSGEENKIDVSSVEPPASQLNRQQQLSMLAQQRRDRIPTTFEDSFLAEDIDEARTRRARENSDASSELFSTFMASERSSVVSWSLSSSWSGSDVSSLESTRATDISLSESSRSSCSSLSFRISDVEEQDAKEVDTNAKDNETRLPEAAAANASTHTQDTDPEWQSQCDRILLFKPIKPRLLRSKKATPKTASLASGTADHLPFCA
ncbi:hypothetical protein Gpo141_00000897 [Globisporangium polare]